MTLAIEGTSPGYSHHEGPCLLCYPHYCRGLIALSVDGIILRLYYYYEARSRHIEAIYVALAIVWSQHCGRVRASRKWTLANVGQKVDGPHHLIHCHKEIQMPCHGSLLNYETLGNQGVYAMAQPGEARGPYPPPRNFQESPEEEPLASYLVFLGTSTI